MVAVWAAAMGAIPPAIIERRTVLLNRARMPRLLGGGPAPGPRGQRGVETLPGMRDPNGKRAAQRPTSPESCYPARARSVPPAPRTTIPSLARRPDFVALDT